MTQVAYQIVDTPIGQLLLATTERGVVRVAFEGDGFAQVLKDLGERVGPCVAEPTAQLETAVREVSEYFAGQRREFEVPQDFSLSTGFRNTVQRYLSSIPYGSTQSYGDVARGVGNPKAVRAVGSACATNPLPIIVPCHRVVRSDGGLGGYGGGLSVKQTLLDLEQQ